MSIKIFTFTIAIPFSKPAWALNSFYHVMIRLESSVEDQQQQQKKIQTLKCDVILVQVDGLVYHMERIANYWRFNREMVVEDNTKSSNIHSSCVQAKWPENFSECYLITSNS